MSNDTKQKNQLHGSNSFIPNGGHKYEYQIDLFGIKHLENTYYEQVMIFIDIFNTYCVVVQKET